MKLKNQFFVSDCVAQDFSFCRKLKSSVFEMRSKFFKKGRTWSFSQFQFQMAFLQPKSYIGLKIHTDTNHKHYIESNLQFWETGQALLRSPKKRNASRDGLVKLGWVHCLQYTVNCFQYNVCDLCRCESSNH